MSRHLVVRLSGSSAAATSSQVDDLGIGLVEARSCLAPRLDGDVDGPARRCRALDEQALDRTSSFDVVDAVGTYDFTQLTVFGWTLDDGPFSPMLILFQQMTIATGAEIFADGFESGDTTAWD